MKKFEFTKMVASGNDFVVIEGKPAAGGLRKLAKNLCDRKFGIGADGLLILEKTKKADARMRIFNADGSEAEMCGNGARCAALFLEKKQAALFTGAGLVQTQLLENNVRIKLTEPKNIKLDIPLRAAGRRIKVNFINTGVPHVVIFVYDVDKIDISHIGPLVRNHALFKPAGTNVNFVEVKGNNSIKIRTFERGVEDETLACGTGSTASALVFALKKNLDKFVKVHTHSGEVLKVYFRKEGLNFRDVWLEGSAKKVYKGEYYV